jgi:hypothetical protein
MAADSIRLAADGGLTNEFVRNDSHKSDTRLDDDVTGQVGAPARPNSEIKARFADAKNRAAFSHVRVR